MKLPWRRYEADPDMDYSEEEISMMRNYSSYVYKKFLFIIICIIGSIVVAGFAISIGSYIYAESESEKLRMS